MPRKNVIKTYCEDTVYHLYNRGIDKRNIFQDEQDHKTFLSLLKKYLSPPPDEYPFFARKSLHKEIVLISYCLMPNHYHLLVKQKTKNGISKLIKNICTNYSMYFNKKYKRIGTLFESRFKAVIIYTDEQLMHLSRYIHINPELAEIEKAHEYPYSSYQHFLENKITDWLNPEIILDYFKTYKPGFSYKDFIENYTEDDLAALDQKYIIE